MEQISYNNLDKRVLRELSGKDNHLRGLAKELGVNHMSIKRVLNILVGKNIVDFNIEGKNKRFFLKKNIESRAEILSSEIYFHENILLNNFILKDIFEQIIKNRKVKMALLFGSYAKGMEHKRSDIDIYVETNNLNLKKQIENINSNISVKIGKFNKEDLLIKEIIDNHIVIKGFEEYYEKTN